jgi:hypothetical protein
MNRKSELDEFFERTRKRLAEQSLALSNSESSYDESKSLSWRITTLVVLFLLILVIIFGIYEVIQGNRIEREQQAIEHEALSKLAGRYNAITDWKARFEDVDEIYVADVQESLIRKDGRPQLVSVEVTDTVKAEDKNNVHFRETNSDYPDVRFILECSPEQIKTITEHRDELTEFVVIASITSIRRANKEDVHADSDPLDTFIATGTSLDLQYFNYATSGKTIIWLTVAFILLLAVLLNRLIGK